LNIATISGVFKYNLASHSYEYTKKACMEKNLKTIVVSPCERFIAAFEENANLILIDDNSYQPFLWINVQGFD